MLHKPTPLALSIAVVLATLATESAQAVSVSPIINDAPTARRALAQRALTREVSQLRRQLAGKQALESRLLGRSPAMQALRELIANVADTSANVLIEGEPGTGKDLVARCLRAYRRRPPRPER
ncbi:sigma 54-interacting transcriptional regulator [Salmonella enterica]|uniref:sigma 54-interacting transcriptional regulator n=1 Tax=Salmonella enterica TaxID=28901 RepID=UPI001AEC5323